MSERSYRAAIIGLGGQGRAHAAAYAELPHVTVVAACDTHEERLNAFVDDYPDAWPYSDVQELLAREKTDIISLAANTPANLSLVTAACAAGVPAVMCEKPMAHSLAAARQMIDAGAASGTRLAINHTRRWMPRYRRLRELLQGDLIGEVGTFFYVSGGALFGCIATHFFDLARMLTGEDFVSVTGGLSEPRRPNPRGPQFHDPGGYALARLEGGGRLFLDVSEDLGVPGRLEIHGGLGRVLIDESRGTWEIEARSGADREQPPWAARNALQAVDFPGGPLEAGRALAAGLAELLGDGPLSSSGVDGYAALEAIVATHLSHEQGGAPVALPLEGGALEREFTFT
jgi:predicted dehydrogenase